MSIKIGLLWHSFSSDNLGVGALSVSHLHILESICREVGVKADYIVYGSPGDMDYLDDGIRDRVLFREFQLRDAVRHPLRTRRGFQECDVVFDIGIGDSFADIYGNRRFYLQFLSKAFVIAAGVPLVFSPQTIGPFDSKRNRLLARFVMKRASMVFPRDSKSMSYVEVVGAGKIRARQSIDVAFNLPYEKAAVEAEPDKLRVGVNVSALLYNGGYSGGNQFGLRLDYPEFIERLLSQLCERNDLDVYLVPHVISERFKVENDYEVSQMLVARHPQLKLAPRFSSPGEAKGFISTMEFFVGSRMHATIAAFSSGVPVVPVAYSRKFEGLFRTVGYGRVVDGKALGTDDAVAEIMRALAEREILEAEISKGRAIASEILSGYELYVKGLLEAIPGNIAAPVEAASGRTL